MYDDCHEFLKAWKATVYDRLERHRFIWREYHYRRLHKLHIFPNLLSRVNEKTIPFLKEHDPDLWLASDMEYEEVLFFQDSEKKVATQPTETEWHEVSPKRRNKKSTPISSPETSPTTTIRKSASIPVTTTTPASQEVIEVLASVETPPRRTVPPLNLDNKRIGHHDKDEDMDIDAHHPDKQQPTKITNPDDTTHLYSRPHLLPPEPGHNFHSNRH